MAKTIALIVAAGSGSRVGGDVPKQYRLLQGKPLLRYSIDALLSSDLIDQVRVVINPDHRSHYEAATTGLTLLPPISGGAERQDSVRSGLEAIAEEDPDLVFIHDAARPFLTGRLIAELIGTLEKHAAVIPALHVADTLKRATAVQIVTDTVDRANLYRVQTPQAFRYREILSAHRQAAGKALTDDAAVAEAAGIDVKLIKGSENLFKVTEEVDFDRAEALLAQNQAIRVGTGFDVHRFEDGTSVTLCGVEIPHNQSLKGHSDADVGLHAITDALYGATGGGDIGEHFPPSDPQWRGVASEVFLRHAGDFIADRGGKILNIDVTLICESPKITPHKQDMVRRIAEILELPLSSVNVKATTTEGLGFTGRREGIAAQATASISMPNENGVIND